MPQRPRHKRHQSINQPTTANIWIIWAMMNWTMVMMMTRSRCLLRQHNHLESSSPCQALTTPQQARQEEEGLEEERYDDSGNLAAVMRLSFPRLALSFLSGFVFGLALHLHLCFGRSFTPRLFFCFCVLNSLGQPLTIAFAHTPL